MPAACGLVGAGGGGGFRVAGVKRWRAALVCLALARGAGGQPADDGEGFDGDDEVAGDPYGAGEDVDGEGSCPAGAAGASCRGEAAPRHEWKAFEGCAIPAGNDIGEAEFITVYEAKERCSLEESCQGFTFEGADPAGPLSGGPVWINLKTQFDCVDAEWIGYRKLEPQRPGGAAPPAPPPPPPPRRSSSASSTAAGGEGRAVALPSGEERGVALCMTGQVRMLSATHLSMEQYLLGVLHPDVFLYGPKNPGEEDGPELYGLEKHVVTAHWEHEDIRTALYSETKGASRVIDLEYLEIQGNWFGNQCLDPPLRDNRPGSAICLYWNQKKCLDMIREEEAARGAPYEFVTITRFDFRWLAPHPPVNLLRDADAVWIPSGSDWEGGINDRHAFMPRRYADIYLGAWDAVTGGEARDVMLDTLGPMKVNGYPGPNTECFLKARLAYHNVDVERFPSVAYLTCTQRVRSRWTQCFGTTTNDAPGWLYKEEMEHAQRIAKCVRSSWSEKKMQDCQEDISHLYRGFR